MYTKILFSVGVLGSAVNYIKGLGLEIWLAKLLNANDEDAFYLTYIVMTFEMIIPILLSCILVNVLGFKGLWWGSISIGFCVMYMLLGIPTLVIACNSKVRNRLVDKGIIDLRYDTAKYVVNYMKVCKSMAMVIFFVVGLLLSSRLGVFTLVFPVLTIIGYFKGKRKGKVLTILQY